MFKTTIDGKTIEVTFQHQRAAHRGQLTRPKQAYVTRITEGLGERITRVTVTEEIREPVYAVTFCFFDGLSVGVAWCSYGDKKRYSGAIGRRIALRRALHSALRRNGRGDEVVTLERRRVWIDYFLAEFRTIPSYIVEEGLPTEADPPPPSDSDEALHSIQRQHIHIEVINHLNEEERRES